MGPDCASLWIRKGRPCNLTGHRFAATDRRGGGTLELLEPSYGDKGQRMASHVRKCISRVPTSPDRGQRPSMATAFTSGGGIGLGGNQRGRLVGRALPRGQAAPFP